MNPRASQEAVLIPTGRAADRDAPTVRRHANIDRGPRHRRRGHVRPPGSDLHDTDDVAKADEVRLVPGVEVQVVRGSGSRYEQVGEPCSAGSPGCSGGCEDPSVGARGIGVEGQGVPGRCSPLETVLPTCTFRIVVRGVWTGSKLGKGDGCDRGCIGDPRRVDEVEIDDDRRVQQTPSV